MSKPSNKQVDELRHLAEQTDEGIDTSDIPADADWRAGERGRFYRPVKKQVTMRLDADVIAWFKSGGARYQTRINAALREYIREHEESR